MNNEDDDYQMYLAEKDEFIARTQLEVYTLWLDHFISKGLSMHDAIAFTKKIVEDWTMRPCNIKPITFFETCEHK